MFRLHTSRPFPGGMEWLTAKRISAAAVLYTQCRKSGITLWKSGSTFLPSNTLCRSDPAGFYILRDLCRPPYGHIDDSLSPTGFFPAHHTS